MTNIAEKEMSAERFMREHPTYGVCATCGEELFCEGIARENSRVYIDYNCGVGGHNTRRIEM